MAKQCPLQYKMSFIIYVLFFAIHVVNSIQESQQPQFKEKVFRFISDIKPEYSVTKQIYDQVNEELKLKNIQMQKKLPPPPPPQPQPRQPVIHSQQQKRPKQAKITQEKTYTPHHVQNEKFVPNEYAQFQESNKIKLKQSKVYELKDISEKSVLGEIFPEAKNTEKVPEKMEIDGLTTKTSLQTTAEIINPHKEPDHKTQPPQNTINQPVVEKQRPQINPEQRTFQQFQRQRQRKQQPQQLIDTQSQKKYTWSPQRPISPGTSATTVPQTPILSPTSITTPTQVPIQTLEKQTDTIQKNLPPVWQQKPQQHHNIYKPLFSLCLGIAILIIVFSYTPQEEKAARNKAYNPTDDQETSLA